MKLFKGFKRWLESLSVKTTIVLTGIGITLFLAMQQAFVGSLATGGSRNDIYAMAFALWITVIIFTFILLTMLLFIAYALRGIKNKIFRKKKVKKQ